MENLNQAASVVDLDFIRRELGSAIISDCLDEMGMRHQCLGAGITPLVTGQPVVGYAFTVESARVDHIPATAFNGLLTALDSIGPDEVFVTPTRRAVDIAVWGELVSTACLQRGAAGALTDGLLRDTAAVRRLGFAVSSAGTMPRGSMGRHEIVAQQVPIEIDGVAIRPRDLIVADDDGAVVIPSERTVEVITAAAAKREAEKNFRSAISGGMGATEGFEAFGVL